MFITRVFVGLFEFVLAVAMSGLVIYMTYRAFIHANPDFDMEEEIAKGNTAVGILVAAIMFSGSMILAKGMDSVVSIFRLHFGGHADTGFTTFQLVAMCIGHLATSMMLALMTISITLRMFGRLTTKLEEGKELQKGNVAVGVLLSSVVLIAAMYVGEGVSSLSKALVPQPQLGRIQIFK